MKLMSVGEIIGIATGLASLLTVIITYATFTAKLKWEIDNFQKDKDRTCRILEEHEKAFQKIRVDIAKPPDEMIQRVGQVEEQITLVRIAMESMAAEIRVLSKLVLNNTEMKKVNKNG